MRINFAHLRRSGVNFAVFDADAKNRTASGRRELLSQLTAEVRRQGLQVDKAALAFEEHGQLKFYGADDLVRFLSENWMIEWTHTLDV